MFGKKYTFFPYSVRKTLKSSSFCDSHTMMLDALNLLYLMDGMQTGFSNILSV